MAAEKAVHHTHVMYFGLGSICTKCGMRLEKQGEAEVLLKPCGWKFRPELWAGGCGDVGQVPTPPFTL